jgi:hypothetical protein
VAELLLGSSAAFFTEGEYLVPVVRDLVPHSIFILSPGRVWLEAGDGGMSRASFPFVLTNPHNNATHNGVATFLYDDTRVSAFRFQVVWEMCPERTGIPQGLFFPRHWSLLGRVARSLL